ncbi:MAG: hypothetical protein HOP19_06085 [Acidobacteria bacterium]|nr:hypothetical protein [Acidobacteriota bacterium]
MNDNYPFIDLALAQRLERTEALACADFVETRARLQPASDACWIEVAGAYAMFDGVGSPITQTFGLGMFEPVTAEVLQQLETFFTERGAAVHHEISPLADPSLLALLHERGYHPIELSSVMYRPTQLAIQPDVKLARAENPKLTVRVMNKAEAQRWADIAAQGWSEMAELSDFIRDLSLVSAERERGVSFFAELKGFAELDSEPIATGGLSLGEGIALMAGASTVPAQRKQGAQLALLEARLQYAAAQGCELAMMCAAPGSASQRNAERQGFRIAYTRLKWGKS